MSDLRHFALRPPPPDLDKATLVEASKAFLDDYNAAERHWTTLVQGLSASQLSALPFTNKENPPLVLGLWLICYQCLPEAELVLRLALSFYNLDEDLLYVLGEIKHAQGELRHAYFILSMLAKQAAGDSSPIVRLGVRRRDEVRALLDRDRDSMAPSLEE